MLVESSLKLWLSNCPLKWLDTRSQLFKIKDVISQHFVKISNGNIILKELKYATHTSSTVTYVFDVLIKSLLECLPDCLWRSNEKKSFY